MAFQRAGRFLKRGSIPVFAVALVLVTGAAFGQDRTEAHERDAGDGERFAVPADPSPPPPEASEPGDPSPPPSAEPSAPSEPDPEEPRTAVPIEPDDTNDRPQRQPPTVHDHGDDGQGQDGGDDSVYGAPSEDDDVPYDASDDVVPSSSGNSGSGAAVEKHRADPKLGALDLDVSPGRTQVYLDGMNIGKVDNYDGWPRYLWLPGGTYQLVFYLDGYKTLVRQFTIEPDLVIDVKDRMVRGPSTRPELLVTRAPINADAKDRSAE